MNDVEKVTNKTVSEGGVLSLLYFDIHTRTKEKAQEIGAGFVQQLLKEPGVVYAVGEIDEPIQDEDLFSTYVQVKILVKSFSNLVNLCAVHSPFNIEIMKPDEIVLPLNQVHDTLMNISTVTSDYKKYILERVTKPEEMERYKKILEQKAELGKKLLEKKSKKDD
jgi:hypothetical protein